MALKKIIATWAKSRFLTNWQFVLFYFGGKSFFFLLRGYGNTRDIANFVGKSYNGVGSDKKPDLQDLLLTTKLFLEGRAEEMKKTMGLPDNINSEVLAKMFNEHNEKMVLNLKETSKTIEEEFKSNPDLRSFLENLKKKFNEEVEKLKTTKSDDIGKSLESNWASLTKLMEQSYEEFQKAGGNKKELDKYFEPFLNKLKQSAQEFEGGRFVKEQQPDFQELLNNTKQFLDEMAKDISFLNLSSEDLTNIFREYNEKVVRSLMESSKEIEEKFKSNPDLHQFVENLKTKFNKEVEKLNTSTSEEVGKSLQNSWGSLMKAMQQSLEEFKRADANHEELEKHFVSLLRELKQRAEEFRAAGPFKQSKFQELLKNTKQVLDKQAEELIQTMGLFDTLKRLELIKFFREYNENLIQLLMETKRHIEEELKSNPELHSLIENIKTNLNKEAEKIKSSGSQNIGKSLQNNWESLIKTMQLLSKDLKKRVGGDNEELDKVFESFLIKLRQSAEEFKKFASKR